MEKTGSLALRSVRPKNGGAEIRVLRQEKNTPAQEQMIAIFLEALEWARDGRITAGGFVALDKYGQVYWRNHCPPENYMALVAGLDIIRLKSTIELAERTGNV